MPKGSGCDESQRRQDSQLPRAIQSGSACCGAVLADRSADEVPPAAAKDGPIRIDARKYNVESLPLNSDFQIFNVDLYSSPASRENVGHYYSLCRDHPNLHVTTSCFTIWRQHKKTNGFAKVIPAVPVAESDGDAPVRVFFFDDNLEWGGAEQSSGICNLRDVVTGDFVDFAVGNNGFTRDFAARHTAIHSSSKYRVVLVKANILDAMEDPEYFTLIIKRFSQPGETLVVYMDVNSTIVCNDTVQGKDVAGTLLSTMFEFMEFTPTPAFELKWEANPPIRIEKTMTLKAIVKQFTSDDHEAYSAFWTEPTCWRFYTEMERKGELRWVGQDKLMPMSAFSLLFKEYLVALQRVTTKDGIAASWFKVFDLLKGKHTVVLNSFGVDTRKVILATVPDERRVLQVTVNHELWDARDVKKFDGQFKL